MTALVVTIIGAAAAAVSGTAWAIASVRRARYKFQFGIAVLRDVPPEQRAAIITAVGEAWPGHAPEVSISLLGTGARSRKALEAPNSP